MLFVMCVGSLPILFTEWKLDVENTACEFVVILLCLDFSLFVSLNLKVCITRNNTKTTKRNGLVHTKLEDDTKTVSKANA